VRGPGIVCAIGACVAATGASGAVDRLRIDFAPHTVQIGTHLTLTIHSTRAGHVRLTATSPIGATRRLALRQLNSSEWRTGITITRVGKWIFRATRANEWATLTVTALEAARNGVFGPLGAADCRPASPRNQVNVGFLHAEVLGTSTQGTFWGLFAFLPTGAAWASEDKAQFRDLVGKQTKIVFKFASYPTAFYAVGPDGLQTAPVWGPERHGSSSWHRQGVEWGAGFTFDKAGCWRIHAAAGGKAGDLWAEVLS
jgi:hypothetical protein